MDSIDFTSGEVSDVVTWNQAGFLKPQRKLSQYLFLYVAPSMAAGLGLFTSKPFEAGPPSSP